MIRTALYEKHKKLGAKIVPFAGYEMPITFPNGINSECYEVRNNVGIFDVSHMGQFRVTGVDSKKYLQKLLINDLNKLKIGDAQYTAMCNNDGGIIDDLILYKEEQSYLLIVNASNIEKNYNWMKKHINSNVNLKDESNKYSLVAIQGPKSRDIIEKILNQKMSNKFYTFKNVYYDNEELMISRTGYTGELGFEIMGSHTMISKIWDKCIELDVKPCGLASRDILRIEMKYCLYGNDMDESITPYESNLGWITALNKDDFIGKENIINKNKTNKLVGFKMIDRGIPRKNYKIIFEDKIVGEVTSGTQSPTLKKGVGMCRVPLNNVNHGQEIAVLIRDKKIKAEIFLEPFLDKTSIFD